MLAALAAAGALAGATAQATTATRAGGPDARAHRRRGLGDRPARHGRRRPAADHLLVRDRPDDRLRRAPPSPRRPTSRLPSRCRASCSGLAQGRRPTTRAWSPCNARRPFARRRLTFTGRGRARPLAPPLPGGAAPRRPGPAGAPAAGAQAPRPPSHPPRRPRSATASASTSRPAACSSASRAPPRAVAHHRRRLDPGRLDRRRAQGHRRPELGAVRRRHPDRHLPRRHLRGPPARRRRRHDRARAARPAARLRGAAARAPRPSRPSARRARCGAATITGASARAAATASPPSAAPPGTSRTAATAR